MISKKWKKALEAATFSIVGIFLILSQAAGKIVIVDGWGDRFFSLFCFGLISAGIGQLRVNDPVDQVKYAISSFILFLLMYVFNITNLFVNDVTLNGIEGSSDIFFALDAFGVESTAQVIQAITYAVPSVVLIFVVINIFHSEDTDDYQQMLIEGATAIGFIIAIGAAGSYFGFGF